MTLEHMIFFWAGMMFWFFCNSIDKYLENAEPIKAVWRGFLAKVGACLILIKTADFVVGRIAGG